jgi:hypothetical protein
MERAREEQILEQIRRFTLPRYDEIPNVGLYLEQAAKYISEYTSVLGDYALTGSMISNYVKKGLVANPVKKQYYREQIAYLMFIAVAKSVLSMDDIRLLFQLQKHTYEPRKAYDYFRLELENVLYHVFGLKPELDTVGRDQTEAKKMLRTTIVAVAHKVYLEQYFAAYYQEQGGDN